jgi:hypothetical protein
MAKFNKNPYGDFRYNWDEANPGAGGPFSDLFREAAERSTHTHPKVTRPAKPTSWLQATVGGFCGQASIKGFTLEVRGGGQDHVGRLILEYSWRDRRGSMLTGQVCGFRGPKLLAQVCSALAEWDPAMMLWRSAFTEVLEGER